MIETIKLTGYKRMHVCRQFDRDEAAPLLFDSAVLRRYRST
jgi:hypothetical protein